MENEDATFGEDIVRKMHELLEKDIVTDFIMRGGAWIIGEIGSDLYQNDSEKTGEAAQFLIKCLDR